VRQGLLDGYIIDASDEPDPVGFMLYRLEEHRAIEVNLVYFRPGLNPKVPMDALFRRFIVDIREMPGWDVVSFAMLGAQEEMIRTIGWYGFKPVGQAIVRFSLVDPLVLQILKNQPAKPLPKGFKLDSWRPEYAGAVAESIHEAFQGATDALWDPRFRSLLGCRRVVGMLTSHMMGDFLPQCTAVLLHQKIPVGFCFLVTPDTLSGNIPLIGVRPKYKSSGFGNALLRFSLEQAIQQILRGKLTITEISATLDTDNWPAIRMYRRHGFQEDYNYPHVYLTADAARRVQFGQWCPTPAP
jgi:ribosomal protein S18 acetylase RimI-like enzyme